MTTLRTLECLVALVDHGSVSAAAAALHMSQPALSHQIASLEKELGTQVAERLWRGVRITAAGRATAEEARVALRAAEQAVKIGQRVARGGAGRIRISCGETMTGWILLPVLRQWRSPRPSSTDAHIEVIGTEEFVAVAAVGHPFAELSHVPIRALDREPFVHYHIEHGMAEWVDQLAARHGAVLDPVLRTRSQRTAAQLAAAGMGVTIVPVSALPPRPAGTVRRLRPAIDREVVAIVAAPSDTLVHQFVADILRRGLPSWAGPT
jgi:DNA-binding transcriptional LysR family regulator